jgi:hypothetical protein
VDVAQDADPDETVALQRVVVPDKKTTVPVAAARSPGGELHGVPLAVPTPVSAARCRGRTGRPRNHGRHNRRTRALNHIAVRFLRIVRSRLGEQLVDAFHSRSSDETTARLVRNPRRGGFTGPAGGSLGGGKANRAVNSRSSDETTARLVRNPAPAMP